MNESKPKSAIIGGINETDSKQKALIKWFHDYLNNKKGQNVLQTRKNRVKSRAFFRSQKGDDIPKKQDSNLYLKIFVDFLKAAFQKPAWDIELVEIVIWKRGNVDTLALKTTFLSWEVKTNLETPCTRDSCWKRTTAPVITAFLPWKTIERV